MTSLYEDPALDFGTDSGVSTPVSNAAPASSGVDGLRSAVDAMGGVGLATPPANVDPRTAAYAQMSGRQEFFTRLGEFGAGVAGQPSPLLQRIEAKRKEKTLQLEELKGSVSALEHGIKITETMDGDARKAFAEQYAGELDKVNPGLGTTFKALAQKPSLLTQFEQYAAYLPTAMQIKLKADPRGFLHDVGTEWGSKALEGAQDRYLLEGPTGATKKLSTIMSGYQQLAPPDMVERFNKDGRITVKELKELNELLTAQGSPAALSPEQMRVAMKAGDEFWAPLGVSSPKHQGEIDASEAKRTDKLKPGQLIDLPLGGTNFAKAAYDPDKKLFPGAEHDAQGFAILGKGQKEGTKFAFPPTTTEVLREVDGKTHKIKIQIGPDGAVRELDTGEVAPAPKEKSPIQKVIEDALKKDKPAGAPKVEPKVVATEVAKRFNLDAAMKGNKLGKEVAGKGFEVIGPSGVLVGYYK